MHVNIALVLLVAGFSFAEKQASGQGARPGNNANMADVQRSSSDRLQTIDQINHALNSQRQPKEIDHTLQALVDKLDHAGQKGSPAETAAIVSSVKDRGNTSLDLALKDAVLREKVYAIKPLVGAGANKELTVFRVDEKPSLSRTLLAEAVYLKKYKSAKALIESGADVDKVVMWRKGTRGEVGTIRARILESKNDRLIASLDSR